MHEVVVTQIWMAGVVGIMVIYGIITAIGILRKKEEE
jgi:hypothetical protein